MTDVRPFSVQVTAVRGPESKLYSSTPRRPVRRAPSGGGASLGSTVCATRRPARPQKTVVTATPSTVSARAPTGVQPARRRRREATAARRVGRDGGRRILDLLVLDRHHGGDEPARVAVAREAERDGHPDGRGDDRDARDEADAAAPVRDRDRRRRGVVGPRHPGSLTPGPAATMGPDAPPPGPSRPHGLRAADARRARPAVGDRAERGGRAPDGVRARLPGLAALRRRRGPRAGRPRADRVLQPHPVGHRDGRRRADLGRRPAHARRPGGAPALVGGHRGRDRAPGARWGRSRC